MASQFTPAPPDGGAPLLPGPTSPRGLYRQFGAPESLLRIHFPKDPNKDPKTSNPWYWYFDFQQPMAFSFLAGVWGPGWVRRAIEPVIKILASDTQPEIPIPPVGFTSLEAAIKNGNTASFGRLDTTSDLFWALVLRNDGASPPTNQKMPHTKPAFNVVRGQIQARDSKTNINSIIQNAAKTFEADWRGEAATYNALASSLLDVAGGFHLQDHFQPALFSVGLPDGPPTTLTHISQQLNAFKLPLPISGDARFLGPVPISAFFNINTITTDAYAFTLKVGQLDPKKWNMSVFPPLDATKIGNGTGSFFSGDFSGFSSTPFPFSGP